MIDQLIEKYENLQTIAIRGIDETSDRFRRGHYFGDELRCRDILYDLAVLKEKPNE